MVNNKLGMVTRPTMLRSKQGKQIVSFVQWKPLNVIMVNVIRSLLWSDFKDYNTKIIEYCYHLVNVIKYALSQSDDIYLHFSTLLCLTFSITINEMFDSTSNSVVLNLFEKHWSNSVKSKLFFFHFFLQLRKVKTT